MIAGATAFIRKRFSASRWIEDVVRIGATITLAVAPGLAILGWFISLNEEKALYPLIGIAILVGCVGIGLLIAAKSTDRSDRDVNSPPRL